MIANLGGSFLFSTVTTRTASLVSPIWSWTLKVISKEGTSSLVGVKVRLPVTWFTLI